MEFYMGIVVPPLIRTVINPLLASVLKLNVTSSSMQSCTASPHLPVQYAALDDSACGHGLVLVDDPVGLLPTKVLLDQLLHPGNMYPPSDSHYTPVTVYIHRQAVILYRILIDTYRS